MSKPYFTTLHARSSYRIPVLIVNGEAYGPGDFWPRPPYASGGMPPVPPTNPPAPLPLLDAIATSAAHDARDWLRQHAKAVVSAHYPARPEPTQTSYAEATRTVMDGAMSAWLRAVKAAWGDEVQE